MDVALNNPQRLIFHKTNQPTNQTTKQLYLELINFVDLCLQIIYTSYIYSYKPFLALSYLQGLICHKTKANQTKRNQDF